MQLVVKISEDTFFDLKKKQNRTEVDNAVLSGKLLPKGHGDLIDRGKLKTHFIGTEQGTDLEVYLEPTIIDAQAIIKADKEQEDTYKYLLNGAESLVKEHPDLVRDIWNCSSCEYTEDECKDCYPELGYKNNKLKRDTEAVKEFVESDAFKKLMKSLDEQDRAATEDVVRFLRDIKAKEQEE